MKISRPLVLFLSFLMISTTAYTQLPANCPTSFVNRVAVAGDSWAQYMFDDGSFNRFLEAYGHADKVAISQTYETVIACFGGDPVAGDFAVSGSEARQWSDEVNFDYLSSLIIALNNNTNIDFVILSIGGNDILAGQSDGGWYKDMDLDIAGSEQALFDRIIGDTEYIMDQVWARSRPDIKFIISGYDYPNFNVEAFCSSYACPKREDLSRDSNGNGSIDAIELITDMELNEMMIGVEEIRQDFADDNEQVFYDNSLGLSHYYFGYDPDLAEGGNEPEGTTPYTPGGDFMYPTDRDNFRWVRVLCLVPVNADPIHLDSETYEYKIKNMYDNILFEEYRGMPDGTFYSEPANDGYVDGETGDIENSGIRVGDDGGFFSGVENEYFGMLSFDTQSLPDDATVTGASMYIMRSGVNDNPFTKGDGRMPVLDIKEGYFGSSESLEVGDATATADGADVGCFHGVADYNKDAIRIDIDPSALEFVNLTGKTQIRLSFDFADWSPEYINFYDGGGAAAYAPPEELETRFAANTYSTRTIRKSIDRNGEEKKRVVSVGDPIQKKEGYSYYEKLISETEEEDGSTTEVYKMMIAIEHPGLSKHMAALGAPAGGVAPFMDISYSVPLPVELVDFKVDKLGKSAVLTWSTASEINNEGFDIEHSLDGSTWNNIGFIRSKGGDQTNNYTFTHNNLEYGINYYRLKIVDFDGQYDYSPIRELRIIGQKGGLSAYPSPFMTELNIEMPLAEDMPVIVRIRDLMGRIIVEERINGVKGALHYTIDSLDKLQAGNYILEIVSDQVYLTQINKM